jgi:hypothetical protein
MLRRARCPSWLSTRYPAPTVAPVALTTTAVVRNRCDIVDDLLDAELRGRTPILLIYA